MAGFCSENSKLKVFLTAKDEKQTSLRMSLSEALLAVHTSNLDSWYGITWHSILKVKEHSLNFDVYFETKMAFSSISDVYCHSLWYHDKDQAPIDPFTHRLRTQQPEQTSQTCSLEGLRGAVDRQLDTKTDWQMQAPGLWWVNHTLPWKFLQVNLTHRAKFLQVKLDSCAWMTWIICILASPGSALLTRWWSRHNFFFFFSFPSCISGVQHFGWDSHVLSVGLHQLTASNFLF